jgi:DNA helicase-2/ATP-dependent DNA helicase PcrA
LTPSQRRAVEHIHGPLLVLAGPGSGKTRVITQRIACMVEQGINSRNILAITFTNKAADEMANRVGKLLPGCRVWISTFHKFCSRLLRQRAEAVGLRSNFSIYDTTDQRQLLKEILHELDIDAVHYPPSKIASRISRAKNDMLSAEDFSRSYEESIGNHMQAVTARVFPEYQKRLLAANAVDFDDLLLHVVTLLSDNPEIRRELDERYRYVLVDEYQDTNLAQYQIVAALSQNEPNLCVTGDPDQSIYGWRGAQIDNILRFERDFPNAVVVRLEQNFRSTKQILRAADSLITHNVHRKAKSLVTENPEGEPIRLPLFEDARQEADCIAAEIRSLVKSDERTYSDFALFYRVNALSRELEQALTRHRVPFQVAAGVAFFQRAEVKDMLAYLRLVHNPADRTAFLRIVNTPRRSIGKTTQSRLAEWANSQGLTLLEAASQAEEHPIFSKRSVKALQAFAALITEFLLADSGSVEALLRTIIDRTGYTLPWEDSLLEQDRQRLANVMELVTAAQQYDEMFADDPTLEGFLEAAGLAGEVDNVDESAGRVILMTLHAAKGLEYPVVYLIGVEQNLIPHERSIQTDSLRDLEEERRLLFVGMTRAEEQLVLTRTRMRNVHGRPLSSIPSDFLFEMNLEIDDGSLGQSSTHSEFDDDPDPDFPSVHPEQPDYLSLDHSRTNESRPSDLPKLITGADLLERRSESTDVPRGFSVGMQVRHPQYGLGTVVTVWGVAKRRTVSVEFDNGCGNKTFQISKCPLQPVGDL